MGREGRSGHSTHRGRWRQRSRHRGTEGGKIRRVNVEILDVAAEVAVAAMEPPACDTDREVEEVVAVPKILLGCHCLLQPPGSERVVRTLGST